MQSKPDLAEILILGRGGDRTVDPGILKDVTCQAYSILTPSAMKMERQSRAKDPNEGGMGWLCFHKSHPHSPLSGKFDRYFFLSFMLNLLYINRIDFQKYQTRGVILLVN